MIPERATTPPTKECQDLNICLTTCANTKVKHMDLEWIASHRDEFEATNATQREHIQRNNEVDLLAKMATWLPLPDHDPHHPGNIAMCGGPVPTLARKWILHRRRTVTFPGTHWTSWLLMRGTCRMLWVRWLWGHIRWDTESQPCCRCTADHPHW